MKIDTTKLKNFLMVVRKIPSRDRPALALDYQANILTATRPTIGDAIRLRCNPEPASEASTDDTQYVDVDVLYKLLLKSDTSHVRLSADETHARLYFEDIDFTVRLPSDLSDRRTDVDFGEEVETHKLSADWCRTVFNLAETYASTDPARINICKAVIENGRLAATDGHRLLLVPAPEIAGDKRLVIPQNVLKIIAYMPSKTDAKTGTLVKTTKGGRFQSGDFSLEYLARHDSQYPDFQTILDGAKNDRECRATCDPEEAINACNLVDPFKGKGESIRLKFEEYGLEFYASSPEGEGLKTVPKGRVTNAPYTVGHKVGVDPSYLKRGLKDMANFADTVQISVGDPFAPIFLTAAEEDPTIIIMPKRL